MTSEFNKAFDHLMAMEGGYSNTPGDRGGEIKFGISKRAFPDVDLPNLTRDGAKSIYWKCYWTHSKLNCQALIFPGFGTPGLAERVFWFAVHSGVGTAASAFQRAYNRARPRTRKELKVDGWIGPVSLRAFDSLSQFDREILDVTFHVEQVNYYYGVVKRDPVQDKFLRGWLRRLV